MDRLSLKIGFVALFGLSLNACSTVSMPSIDFMDLSDFRSEIDALDDDYPAPEDTPAIPTDIREDAAWDDAVRDLQQLGEDFQPPAIDPVLSDSEFDSQFEALKEKGQAYKADDPQ